MTDKALDVAYNPNAPADERDDALREAQKAAMPSTVQDMVPVIEFIQRQQAEQEFQKALTKPNVLPFPSKNVRGRNDGMQSVYLDDFGVNAQGDYYNPPGTMSFDMMRQMVDRTPVLSSVVLTRQRQIKRFCRVQEHDKGPGFAIRMKDQSKKLGKREQQSIEMLESFFTNCGWEANPRQRAKLKRDNFSGLMAKLVRDSLVLDSAPIELEWKRDRSKGLDGLYAVDGASIRLCPETGYRDDPDIFALQLVQGNVRTAYTLDDLIYVPRNPRTDILVGGYGMSETELLVNTVTGFLNAMTYNLKYFDSNAVPKGILHLSGDYGQEDIAAFKRYWNAMVRGIDNAWTMPVMVSKDQESRAAFEKFGVDQNEIMFAKWMTFLASIICAIYGMAPDEINFESFTSGTSTLSGSDTEEKLIHSKDKGLRPLLSHFEDLFSDYIVAEFGDQFVFRWTGLDEITTEQSWVEEQALCTVNEARKARGKDEVPWGDAPLNSAVMGAYMNSKDAEAAADDPGASGNMDKLNAKLAAVDDGADSNPEDNEGMADAPLAKAMPDVGFPVFVVEP